MKWVVGVSKWGKCEHVHDLGHAAMCLRWVGGAIWNGHSALLAPIKRRNLSAFSVMSHFPFRPVGMIPVTRKRRARVSSCSFRGEMRVSLGECGSHQLL